jgi:GDP-4-dehydro-6-deoxy-D-mannose reductase
MPRTLSTITNMTRSFITGVSGFVGTHLSRYLLAQGWYVAGQDLKITSSASHHYQTDLHDRMALRQALVETNPDVVFHLAGILRSEQSEQYYRAHVEGTVTLLDTIVESGLRPKVLIASSSAVYGPGQGSRPITEGFKLRPVTQYAASKVAQEVVAIRYLDAVGLPVTCVRSFNLLGPGLSSQMACSAFAWQIAQAEKMGNPASILTGNLNAQRDFVDVRDAVRAYALVAQKGQPGHAYNVASGRAIAIRACLEFMQGQAIVPIDSVVDPARIQKNDIPIQIGSARRLYELTGWKPEFTTEQSLVDLLDDWREKVNSE